MKTHPLNVSYLVVGLAFLGIAGSWALREADVVDTGDVGWLVPLTLVAAGVIGLVAFLANGSRRSGGRNRSAGGQGEPAGWADDTGTWIDEADQSTDQTTDDTTVLPTHEEKP